MTGLESLHAARLSGLPIDRLVIEMTGIASHGTEHALGFTESVLVVEKTDSAPRCDLRLSRGIPVSIFAPSWKRGWPFFEAAIEHEPTSITLHSADMVATWSAAKGLQTWEL